MLIIGNDGSIRVTRGDSFSATLFINQGTEFVPMRYVVGDNDTVYFGVMEPNQKFEDAVIRKKWTYDTGLINQFGDLMITLTSDDTILLHPGKYYYQIKMKYQTKDGEKVTSVTPSTEFWVLD